MPETNVLRAAFKVVSIMEIGGLKDKLSEIAYQLMCIVEARRINDPKKILSTFDVVTKIFDGTSGHVTPRDLNVFLRQSGPMAHTLSDDGLINMAAVIWEDKKSQGQ